MRLIINVDKIHKLPKAKRRHTLGYYMHLRYKSRGNFKMIYPLHSSSLQSY